MQRQIKQNYTLWCEANSLENGKLMEIHNKKHSILVNPLVRILEILIIFLYYYFIVKK